MWWTTHLHVLTYALIEVFVLPTVLKCCGTKPSVDIPIKSQNTAGKAPLDTSKPRAHQPTNPDARFKQCMCSAAANQGPLPGVGYGMWKGQ